MPHTTMMTNSAGADVGVDDMAPPAFPYFDIDDDDWFADAIEEDSFWSPMPFDASENGLFNGKFVPPPPRPPWLDKRISSDGLTTCDLCSWALQDRNSFSFDSSTDTAAREVGLILIMVSVVSAIIGAIIMIAIFKCRRSKTLPHGNNLDNHSQSWWWSRRNRAISTIDETIVTKNPLQSDHHAVAAAAVAAHRNPEVWIWLKNINTNSNPEQIGYPPTHSLGNYYTNTDDPVNFQPRYHEAVYEEITGVG